MVKRAAQATAVRKSSPPRGARASENEPVGRLVGWRFLSLGRNVGFRETRGAESPRRAAVAPRHGRPRKHHPDEGVRVPARARDPIILGMRSPGGHSRRSGERVRLRGNTWPRRVYPKEPSLQGEGPKGSAREARQGRAGLERWPTTSRKRSLSCWTRGPASPPSGRCVLSRTLDPPRPPSPPGPPLPSGLPPHRGLPAAPSR